MGVSNEFFADQVKDAGVSVYVKYSDAVPQEMSFQIRWSINNKIFESPELKFEQVSDFLCVNLGRDLPVGDHRVELLVNGTVQRSATIDIQPSVRRKIAPSGRGQQQAAPATTQSTRDPADAAAAAVVDLPPAVPPPEISVKQADKPQVLTYAARHRHILGSCSGELKLTPVDIEFFSDKHSFKFGMGEVELDKDGIRDRSGKEWHFSITDQNVEELLRSWKSGRLFSRVQSDVVVQFDPTSLQRSSDQSRAVLRQVEAEIQRANAQQKMREEQILTDLQSARFGVERARLDASTQEVIPALEHEKNLLALEKAERKLREVETRIATSRIGAEADLAGVLRRRDKARADLEQAERNLAALTLTSPVEGIVSVLPNSRARTSIIGGTAPVFKEGDRLWAGAAIVEVPDLSTIQANAPVYEADRGKIAPGQPVTLQVEAVPDREHKGLVSTISPLAKLDYSSFPIRKSFDLAVRLDQPDPRLRPGMSATFRVEVERLPGSILIPAEAVFDRGGRTMAYVLAGSGFEERPLELARRGAGRVQVARGLKQGERVALEDPKALNEKD